ncbi:DUF2062 domain-containing protein [Roseovarius salis]|uniref:DUF2062 domain-containing protein n=1 Tax=Roseovarius salis TaxID=3376063 RepID=UPI0037CB985C
MVFKRRDRRPIWKIVVETVWPRGGWTRAFYYIKHRLHRLPDPPHRIARGIFAGVCVTFSPFFGMHFFLAAGMALLIRGNVVASLLATFVGNPLTFVPIATLAYQTGNVVLGRIGTDSGEIGRSIGGKFVDAWGDLKHNIVAIFTDARADWHNLEIFYDEVFFPYMIGGFITGPIAGLVFYYLSLPVIQAYQNRRKGRLKAKLMALREKAAGKADAKEKHD